MKAPSLTKNFVLYLLKTLVGMFASIVLFPYAARMLGPEGIGKVQYAQTWVVYFQTFASLGVSYYAVREGTRLRDNPIELGRLCTEMVVINVVTTLLAYLAFFVFLFTVPQVRDYRGLLLLFSVNIFSMVLHLEWVYSILEDYTYISIRSIVVQCVSFVLLFLLVHGKEDYYKYAFVLVLPNVVTALMNIWHSRHLIHWASLRGRTYFPHIKSIVLMFGITLTATIYATLDTTMLGIQLGDQAVGYYTAATKLSRAVATLVSAVCTVFLPRLSYYAGNEHKQEFEKLSTKAINIILGVAIPSSIGLALLAPELIEIFSGQEFMAAVGPMRILAFHLTLASLDTFFAWQILVPMKREAWVLTSTLAGSALDGILNAVFIPIFQVQGAAAATLIAEACVIGFYLIASRKFVPLCAYFANCYQYILACFPFVVVWLVAQWLHLSTIAIVVFVVPVCSVLYVSVLLLLKNEMISIVKEKLLKK